MPATISKPILHLFSPILIFLLVRPVHHHVDVITCKSITHFFFNLAACSGEYSLFSGSCNRQFGGGHRRNTLKARLFLQSFLLRYACWTGTRSYLTTTTVSFLFFVSLEMSLFPANFVPFIAVSSLYGEYVVRFPLSDGVFLPCGHGLDYFTSAYYVRFNQSNKLIRNLTLDSVLEAHLSIQ